MSAATPLTREKRLLNYWRQNDRHYRSIVSRNLTVAQKRQLRKTDTRREAAEREATS